MLHAMLPKPKPVRIIKAKKRKKATSRTLLERRLDSLVREIVLDRDGLCVCPAPKKGHGNALQCGHLISRAKKKVKWDLFNCNVQCNSCNFIHEHHPHFYTQWFLREFGAEQYERVCKDSEEIGKGSTDELETLLSELTSIRRRQLDDLAWRPYFTQKQIQDGTWRNYERKIRVDMPNLLNAQNVHIQASG